MGIANKFCLHQKYFFLLIHKQKKNNYSYTNYIYTQALINRKMQQSLNKTQEHCYTAYLQSLLTAHKIPYLSASEYSTLLASSTLPTLSEPSPSTNNFGSGPLQTNLGPQLHSDRLLRYSRQMLLKEIGYQGQIKLSQAKIAIIGAGGIGCPLAIYLAAAGVGTIGIYDSDKVEMSNLHRQIGHRTSTINIPKTSSLSQTIHNINPYPKIQQHPFITPQTVHTLKNYSLVIDGSDNPKCRYIVNDYLTSQNKGLLSGACVGWQGQITYYGNGNACYRCLWGDKQTSVGNCATIGVVGMVPGLVAMLLGVEAVKIIVQGKSSLQGCMIIYDGKGCNFRKVKLRGKKDDCKACGIGDRLDVAKYQYSQYDLCSTVGQVPEVANNIQWSQMINNMKQNKAKKQVHVDVRPSPQYNIQHIKNSINIPYQQLKSLTKQEICQKLDLPPLAPQQKENPSSYTVYISCKSGIMSKFATQHLKDLGIGEVYNVVGGINLYGKKFDSSIANI